MSRGGPKPKISHELVFQSLEAVREKLFDSNGKLMPCTSEIWTNICNDLDNKLTPNSLYISVYQNRHSWLSRLNYNSNSSVVNDSTSIYNESDSGSSKSEKSISSNSEKNIKCFSFEISYHKFIKMKPTNVIYGNKKHKKSYTVLKPGVWTNIINDEFLNNYKMPCNYVYRRCRIANDSSRSKNFLTFQAKCKDCGVILHGWANRKPEEGLPLQLNIQTEDTRDKWENHHSQRSLKGHKRSKVGKNLSKDTASNWQRRAVSSLEFGDHMPPNIYNKSVLWKCKQQFNDNFLGITEKCPIKSLIDLKHGKYAGSIHTISADKLFIHYWTPTQLIVYKHVQKSYCRLSIDATGSLVKKLKRTKQNILSGHIFLYEAVINTTTYQVPVTQMLSEKHDTLTIFYWLAEWIREGIPIPQETACDYSKALLGAISRAFCGATLGDYVDKCFNVLFLKSIHDLPPCYIRIDIAHLVKLVCRWNCLSGFKNNRLKEFYVRCVILLVEVTCLEEFEKLLFDILLVSMSQTEGEKICTGKCPAEEARIRLLNNIRGCKILETDVMKSSVDSNDLLSNHLEEENDVSRKKLKQNSKVYEFLNRIKTKSISESLVEGDRISPYYLPEFTTNILRLCKEFPLWSNIMCSFFKSPYTSATSAAVEGDFALLKKNILKHNTTPMTVDRFIVTHLMSIESAMKFARSNQIQEYSFDEMNKKNKNKSTKTVEMVHQVTQSLSPSSSFESIPTEKEFEFNLKKNDSNHSKNQQYYETNIAEKKDNEIEIDEQQVTTIISPNSSFNSEMTINQEETWGGLTTFETGPLKHSLKYANTIEKNKKRSTKYVESCPEIDRILNRSRMRSHLSSLILNGNISPLCVYNKKKYLINNTCPFDSIIVAVAVAYIDYEKYTCFIDESKNEFLTLAKDLGLYGASKLTYRKRLILLMPHFDISTCVPSVYTLNAECNVLKVVQDYMKHDSSSTQTTICSNKLCPRENEIRHSASIILNELHLIHKKGFSCLQYLLENYAKSECRPCYDNKCNGITRCEKKFGNHVFIETDQLSLESSTFTCFLNEIPVNIFINEEKYILVAVIHYISFHYVTYTRRGYGQWEKHNDLQPKIKTITNFNKVKVNPQVLMYIRE